MVENVVLQYGVENDGQFTSIVLQAVDPSAVTGLPVVVQVVLCFVLTVLFGGVANYRYGDRINDAVEASTANPLLSVLYGLIAHGLVTFFVVYAYSELTRLGVATTSLAVLSVGVLGILLLSLGGFGYAVVGTWITSFVGTEDRWRGLVTVSAVVASAWFFLPFTLAGFVWLAIAAVGIGGPTRKWIHHSAEPTES